MSAPLPDSLRQLGATLPLPEPATLRLLARHELLSPWCQRRLLEELATTPLPELPGEEELTPKLEEHEEQLQAYAQRCGLSSLEELEPWRQARGLSLQELEDLAAFEQRLAVVTRRIWGAEVPGIFLQRRGEFDQVVLTMVRMRDPDLATELFFQLQEGECGFHEVVERYAEDSDRLRRGVVGPVVVNQLNPVLMRVVRRYGTGELIPPLDIGGVVHLIRVESVQPARLDDRLREQLLLECRSLWLRDQLQRLRDRLMQVSPPMEASS